jgi:2-C-methyl-D-erythritol 2,4-cyclodiphosphate synthase
MRLGGVSIEFPYHLVGHSDADVLLHAVTDSLLGAVALGDIGDFFSDTDGANQGRDSAEFLRDAVAKVRELGFEILNLDCILHAERPKLLEYKIKIKQRLAELLDIPASKINVKAKTGEQVGPVGRQEAIMAESVVLLSRASRELE